MFQELGPDFLNNFYLDNTINCDNLLSFDFKDYPTFNIENINKEDNEKDINGKNEVDLNEEYNEASDNNNKRKRKRKTYSFKNREIKKEKKNPKPLGIYDKTGVLPIDFELCRGRARTAQLKKMTKKQHIAVEKAVRERSKIIAKECRENKKEYILYLENKVEEYENIINKQENEIKNLKKELKKLKLSLNKK